MNIGIIGGGASGMMSAIILSKCGYNVTILEKNDALGKKILMTGNGRCNYFNENISIDKYYTDNYELLSKIITKDNQMEVLDFFNDIGIVPQIKNGYYYPYSNNATSILNTFLVELSNNKVNIKLNTLVTKIIKKNNKYNIITNDKKYIFDKLIISIGSNAGYKDNTNIYEVLNNIIDINPIKPALVPLILKGNFFNKWSGIRVKGSVSLYKDNTFLKSDIGEIQLTDYGVSGIVVMNLSSLVSNNNAIHINFLYDVPDIEEYIKTRNNLLKNRNLVTLLESIIPYKLLYILYKEARLNPNANYKSLTLEEKERLYKVLTDFTLEVVGTKDISKAQVVDGGISLYNVTDNLEDKNNKGIYYTGEILNVDGECGGYNLGFAWLSSLIVTKSIKKR